eukprot:CAMPEP_0203931494 /NCGR_PEP_ID=MMETSP0359-20131031/70081_1 /ASSEMBLY_ACC=CAM_ASM_000338 /TAXON_ID=268821 /ORGANISM="Scrippsiella Hangoei, Strain SHTV-5" /LENGTH=225 /DNA_ID=CAMNT_0050860843 /DNA_START=46 /DNA_END=724 /DNA_ORIENTATION=+
MSAAAVVHLTSEPPLRARLSSERLYPAVGLESFMIWASPRMDNHQWHDCPKHACSTSGGGTWARTPASRTRWPRGRARTPWQGSPRQVCGSPSRTAREGLAVGCSRGSGSQAASQGSSRVASWSSTDAAPDATRRHAGAARRRLDHGQLHMGAVRSHLGVPPDATRLHSGDPRPGGGLQEPPQNGDDAMIPNAFNGNHGSFDRTSMDLTSMEVADFAGASFEGHT